MVIERGVGTDREGKDHYVHLITTRGGKFQEQGICRSERFGSAKKFIKSCFMQALLDSESLDELF